MAASFANIIRKHNLVAEDEHDNNVDDKIVKGMSHGHQSMSSLCQALRAFQY